MKILCFLMMMMSISVLAQPLGDEKGLGGDVGGDDPIGGLSVPFPDSEYTSAMFFDWNTSASSERTNQPESKSAAAEQSTGKLDPLHIQTTEEVAWATQALPYLMDATTDGDPNLEPSTDP